MKKPSVLISIGVAIAALDVVGERTLNIRLPSSVIIGSTLIGLICVLLGYGMHRNALTASGRFENAPRGRSYVFFVFAVLSGVVIGFFGCRAIYDDAPLWIPGASCIMALVAGLAYYYWEIFLRRRRNPGAP